MSKLSFSTQAEGLDIELHDIASINYLVGANGSGKSRLLRALSSSAGTFSPSGIIWQSTSLPPPLQQEYSRNSHPLDNIEQFESIFELTGQTQITVKKKPVKSITDLETGKTEVEEAERYAREDSELANFDLSKLSDGTKRLRLLLNQLLSQMESTRPTSPNDVRTKERMRHCFLVCIEEPETMLHPLAQKKLHNEFEKIFSSYEQRQFNVDVKLFVTTHSPFLISGASKAALPTKVYMLKDGKNCDVFDKIGTPESKRGYSADAAILTSHYLLGSGFNDFFPGRMVYCEESVRVLLKGLTDKFGKPLNCLFLTANGDQAITQKSKAIAGIFKQIEHIQGKVLKDIFTTKILLVLDEPPNGAYKRCADSLKTDGGGRFDYDYFSPNADELEQLYPLVWINEFLSKLGKPKWGGKGTSNFKTHLTTNCGLKGPKVGKLKADLANFVVGKTCTRDDVQQHLPIIDAFMNRHNFFQ